MESRILNIAFLHVVYDDPEEPLLNRVTASFGKHDVCHVELGFNHTHFFSIMEGSPATLRPKTLSNLNYQIFNITVTPEQYNKCYKICEDLDKRNIQFDNFGMYCVYLYKSCICCQSLPHTPLDKVTKTFCSKIITQILQEIKLAEVADLHPASTTPSDLLECLRLSPKNVIGCATRLNNPNLKIALP